MGDRVSRPPTASTSCSSAQWRDNPGYFLDDFGFARDVIVDLKIPNLKLQFDFYHCQIMHGDVTMRLREMMPIVGHVRSPAFRRATNLPARN